ncbi:MAG: hypothetical protein JSV86_05440 [Gemmatimonadota bacterium]|nr:MAG: hypothetical protein JSV86_05440 [Gemmatimonadota bacterium]
MKATALQLHGRVGVGMMAVGASTDASLQLNRIDAALRQAGDLNRRMRQRGAPPAEIARFDAEYTALSSRLVQLEGELSALLYAPDVTAEDLRPWYVTATRLETDVSTHTAQLTRALKGGIAGTTASIVVWTTVGLTAVTLLGYSLYVTWRFFKRKRR